MQVNISPSSLIQAGMSPDDARVLSSAIENSTNKCSDKSEQWDIISKRILTLKKYPFVIHKLIFSTIFPHEPTDTSNSPAWMPDQSILDSANISQFMFELGINNVETLHEWSTQHYGKFWDKTIKRIGVTFKQEPDTIIDLSEGIESPRWFPQAKLNISDSCFKNSGDDIALMCPDSNNQIRKITYAQLNALSNQVANYLVEISYLPGDPIGIVMPMNIQAVAIYLGIIKMGGVVVSIADSFSSEEIYVRLKITSAKGVFTQESLYWAGKALPLYQKVVDATKLLDSECQVLLFDVDRYSKVFSSYPCDPMAPSNILFSSGTTAEPKAIIWNHTTPIKAASDAFYHQNIKPGDVLAWPTNLGWMMGPWLIYAALINQATIALYPDAPKDQRFGEYVQNAKVTMLGVVPTLVAIWRESHCMENLDWSSIKVFSSTGECSNPVDMLYLMALAGYKPVIEYCGGTEIGGAFISSTVVQKNYPSLFTTPTLGMNFTIIDENGKSSDIGEVAIIPPCIGLSTELMNANHHDVYYKNMPLVNNQILRRHGDQLRRFPNNTYGILGRVDDTMNLGGIKVSAAEIERAVANTENVLETAAVAVTPAGNGPSQLVIYVVSSSNLLDKDIVKMHMQKRINQFLNPLYKIADIVFVSELPKTASNKIMRRKLRVMTPLENP